MKATALNSQSRRMNSSRNIIVGLSVQVIILLLNLIGKSIFIRTLGTEYLGVNGLFTNLFIVLSFAEHGMGPVMLYYLYAPIRHHDLEKLQVLYHYFSKLYKRMTLWMSGLGLIFLLAIPLMVQTESALPHLSLAFSLYLISVLINNRFGYKLHMIIADQRKYKVHLMELIFDGGTLILQIIVLLMTGNYILYLSLVLLKSLLFSGFIEHVVKKMYPFLRTETNISYVLEEQKEIHKKIIDVLQYRMARVMMTGTDNIIISILIGTIWVGYYSNYEFVIMGVTSLVAVLFGAVSASVGHLSAGDPIIKQQKIFFVTQNFSFWISGFTTACLAILVQDFIRLWLKRPELILNPSIVVVILVNYYLVSNRNVIRVFRNAAGLFEKVKHIMFLAAAINLVLSIIMGSIWGLFGVLFATVLSTVGTFYWYEAKIVMKYLGNLGLGCYLKEQMKGALWTISGIGLCFLGTGWIDGSSYIGFGLKAALCVLIINIWFAWVLRKSDAMEIMKEWGMKLWSK